MYDIIFIHNKPWPDQLLEDVKERFPLAKITYDSDPFSIAVNYAKSVRTKMFWIIPTIQILDFQFLNITPTFTDRIAYLEDVNANRSYLVPAKKKVEWDDFEAAKYLIGNRYTKSSILYDVFFISYNESYADTNWLALKQRVPTANRINGVKGIAEAHRKAALGTATRFLWVVDADAVIDEKFKFTHEVSNDHFDTVHIWKSFNPVNGLEYGYGGIKLLPKHLLLEQTLGVDVTTSLSHNVKILNETSNTTEFATTPFEAWKGAFRECAKLSSQIIHRQNTQETEARLKQWLEPTDHILGKFINDGAVQGDLFGKKCRDIISALSLINDFDWLKAQFDDRVVAIGNTEEIT